MLTSAQLKEATAKTVEDLIENHAEDSFTAIQVAVETLAIVTALASRKGREEAVQDIVKELFEARYKKIRKEFLQIQKQNSMEARLKELEGIPGVEVITLTPENIGELDKILGKKLDS